MKRTRVWTPQRLRIFSGVVIALVLLHIGQVFFADTVNRSMLKRGDFSSFYAASMIVRQGMTERLYDTELLKSVQNLYWPSLNGSFVLFPYPPFAAFFLAPLAWFPPLTAKLIFTLLMIASLILAIRLTAKDAPVLRNHLGGLTAFLLAFSPLTFGIVGGQNIALSMALYAAVLYFFSKNDPKADWIAGLCLGIWFFKPHYSLVLGALFLLAGYYRVVTGAAIVGIFYFLLSAGLAGRDWIFTWLTMLQEYVALESQFNFFNMISLHGFLAAATRTIPAGETTAAVLNFLSVVGSVILLGILARAAFRLRKKETSQRRLEFLKLLRLAMPVILLASPHTLFYDFGLCLVALAPFIRLETDKSIWMLIGLTLASSLAVSFRAQLPVQPLFLGLAGILVYLMQKTNVKRYQVPRVL